MLALRPRSSFQELMELVTAKLENSTDQDILAILNTLRDLRKEFEQDRDLLESVIHRLEAVLRGRH